MSTIDKHVVVAIDGASASIALLDWATRYAVMTGADLTVVVGRHPARPAGRRRQADSGDGQALELRIQDLVNQTCSGIPHRVVLEDGAPAGLLLREAQGAQLLVMGCRPPGGRGETSRVADAVLTDPPCPVVLIPVACARTGAAGPPAPRRPRPQDQGPAERGRAARVPAAQPS